jgi:hypothetical protein
MTDFFHTTSKKTASAEDQQARTTSKQPTAQSTFTGGEPRSTTTATKDEGIVTDTKGSKADTATPESSWTKSSSGNVVVYSPAQNSVLKSGETLSGSATASRVSFRLIDNVSGVISQGSISVVNGKFSGTFDFDSKATEGRVDVFTVAPDGTESNNVSIPVKF